MNRLNHARRIQVVRCICEGMGIRSTSRFTGVAKNTIVKLLAELGTACAAHHDQTVRNLKVRRLRIREIWMSIGAKGKNAPAEKGEERWNDVWTWTALDPDTKLCVSYLVGQRDARWAYDFMQDCADRIGGRAQITVDGHRAFLEVVEDAFGVDCDDAQLQKIYGDPAEQAISHSAAQRIGIDMKTLSGNPDPGCVATSHDAFSRRVDNHAHAVALFFAYYNFCRVHQVLRITPAMEGGLSDHVWSVDELVRLLNAPNAQRTENALGTD